MDPRSVEGSLLEPEEQAIAEAVDRRIDQFTAGRVCARQALARLGVDAGIPVLQGEDRAPIWPDGFVGSITHTDSWCAAAVARASEVRAIGIDLEPSTPLKESVLNRICTPAERQWLAEVSDPGLMGKVVFSAKEAVYKCQYPLTHEFLGFHAVALDLEDGFFRAVFQQDAGELRRGDSISGRYLIEEGIVATACALGAR
ncbi:MAG: 4'-phosphopantetheinyl transferase superfamily protein [Deltaproteobacteria bacterium]|nr:4'-phosphopantetheinyl transferase superfamily protein [Deltaproteobacteria bacterium]